MNSVYVLTEGDYSDYHIIGVYSTKELAEKAQFVYENSQIEEFALDDVPDYPPGMKAWLVTINDADTSDIYSYQTTPDEHTIPSENEYHYHHTKESGYFVYCWATDQAHAEKIALDKYYQHQAHKAGIA